MDNLKRSIEGKMSFYGISNYMHKITFLLTITVSTISSEPIITATFKAPHCVVTLCIDITTEISLHTLIDVCIGESKSSLNSPSSL